MLIFEPLKVLMKSFNQKLIKIYVKENPVILCGVRAVKLNAFAQAGVSQM